MAVGLSVFAMSTFYNSFHFVAIFFYDAAHGPVPGYVRLLGNYALRSKVHERTPVTKIEGYSLVRYSIGTSIYIVYNQYGEKLRQCMKLELRPRPK